MNVHYHPSITGINYRLYSSNPDVHIFSQLNYLPKVNPVHFNGDIFAPWSNDILEKLTNMEINNSNDPDQSKIAPFDSVCKVFTNVSKREIDQKNSQNGHGVEDTLDRSVFYVNPNGKYTELLMQFSDRTTVLNDAEDTSNISDSSSGISQYVLCSEEPIDSKVSLASNTDEESLFHTVCEVSRVQRKWLLGGKKEDIGPLDSCVIFKNPDGTKTKFITRFTEKTYVLNDDESNLVLNKESIDSIENSSDFQKNLSKDSIGHVDHSSNILKSADRSTATDSQEEDDYISAEESIEIAIDAKPQKKASRVRRVWGRVRKSFRRVFGRRGNVEDAK